MIPKASKIVKLYIMSTLDYKVFAKFNKPQGHVVSLNRVTFGIQIADKAPTANCTPRAMQRLLITIG